MTPPTAVLAPARQPVPVTIGRRPPTTPNDVPPVPLAVAPIGDDEFRIIADLDEAAEGAECSCSAGEDQPY
ncbi:hypothetical protein SAMN05216251_11770 [Actinacidiphila alni]|uniref:Uncharacterized protein n=1 Tax=Actinacidiphila alni TaxID=380248 RepID=A0A1I2JGK5_9ACTN|nr:hypothetical protein [Actinacidiphila alni]SFF51986.1 hypothetical protein SAMN05216251_11770 [Actinacidiphila alni]